MCIYICRYDIYIYIIYIDIHINRLYIYLYIYIIYIYIYIYQLCMPLLKCLTQKLNKKTFIKFQFYFDS